MASALSSYDYTLDETNKGIDSPVKQRNIVTAVELFSFSYARDYSGSGDDIFDGSLAIGEHVLLFDNYYPIFDTTITGTATLTITDEGRNWVILDVTGAGTVIITRSYFFQQRKARILIENESLPSGSQSNIISISNAYLVFPDIHEDTAQRVYDYYQQRYVQKTRLYANQIKVGDSVLIDTQSGKQIRGNVERAEIDLVGGFISDIEIIGDIVT
jgi:hypothetical protein